MPKKNTVTYDIDEEVFRELKLLVAKLDSFCFANKIPYFSTFAIKNTDRNTEYYNSSTEDTIGGVSEDVNLSESTSDSENCVQYYSSARSPFTLQIELADERILKHIKVHRGFEVIMPERLTGIVFENKPVKLPDITFG